MTGPTRWSTCAATALALLMLAAPAHAAKIVAGQSQTCAIAADQTVRCWGTGMPTGLVTGFSTSTVLSWTGLWIGDDEPAGGRGPVDLGPVDTAKSLAAGTEFTCALRTDDTVVCWGNGLNGKLGYGDTQSIGDDETPGARVVDLGPVDTAKAITAGINHACALRPNH